MNRYLMTQSLLSSWKYQFNEFYDLYDDEETAEQAELRARDSFISSLNREPIAVNPSMLKGRDFETLVQLLTENKTLKEVLELEPKVAESALPARSSTKTNFEKWYDPAKQIAEKVRGGVFQASINGTITVGSQEFVLHGKLDVLKAGVIYDIKFASRYEYGNYFDSAQHPMYMAIVPEAREFTYLVYREYSGLFEETYRREETRDIGNMIAEFMRYLEEQNLIGLYKEKWLAQ